MNSTNTSRIEQAEQALMRAYLYLLEGESRESVKRSRYAMQYAYLAFQECMGTPEIALRGETLCIESWLGPQAAGGSDPTAPSALPNPLGVTFTQRCDEDAQSALHDAEAFVARVREYLASHVSQTARGGRIPSSMASLPKPPVRR